MLAFSALGADTVSVTGSGSGLFANKNVGAGKAVAVTGYSLSGADASNYSAVQPTGLTADIIPASLAIAGIGANNKMYDASTVATLSGTASVSALGSDNVSVTNGAGHFDNLHAGVGKTVTFSGFVLSGADADNHQAVQPIAGLADIARRPLSAMAPQVVKVFNGTTYASGTVSVGELGLANGHQISSTTLTYSSPSVGLLKTVTPSNAVISGLGTNSDYDISYLVNRTSIILFPSLVELVKEILRPHVNAKPLSALLTADAAPAMTTTIDSAENPKRAAKASPTPALKLCPGQVIRLTLTSCSTAN